MQPASVRRGVGYLGAAATVALAVALAGGCGRGSGPQPPPSPTAAALASETRDTPIVLTTVPSPTVPGSPAAATTATVIPTSGRQLAQATLTPAPTIGQPLAQVTPRGRQPEIRQTATPDPTGDRRQIQPTPTPTPGPQIVVRGERPSVAFELKSLSIPGCSTSPGSGVGANFGTLPAPKPLPTVTPVTRSEFRSAEIASREIGEYLVAAGSVISAAAHWTGITENQWPKTQTLEGRGALVFAESRRIAALCNAIALADAPPETVDAHRALAAALTGRQKWAADAASLLRDSKPASAAGLESARTDSAAAFDAALARLESLAARFDMTLAPGADARVLDNSRGRVSLQVPAGWFVVRADSQSVLVALPDLQVAGIEGLGPGREGYGSALRVRRLRNAPGQTLSDALVNIRVLLDEFGELRRTADIAVDGHDGVEWRLVNRDTGWQTWFVLTLAGDFTFIFEMGCPGAVSSECDRIMRETLAGTRLRP